MEYIYDTPSRPPQESAHWQSLPHQDGDVLLDDLAQVQAQLVADLDDKNNDKDGRMVAVWSTLLGYCEALCTSPIQEKRYHPYPIPIDAIKRLVHDEFTPPMPVLGQTPRQAARDTSHWVWSKVTNKSNVKDEKHANSLYTVLRGGRIENKSVDCFGAALVTVVGLRMRQAQVQQQQQQGPREDGNITPPPPASSLTYTLQLSEDHAYARLGNETYEVAIPGTTKAQQKKRGQEIAQTFQQQQSSSSSSSSLTPATSWLYMAESAVTCDTWPMILAAALANVNCLIETKAQQYERYSRPLLLLKRELLWILKNGGRHLDKFPFALCELGWTEEQVTSPRGRARVMLEWEDEESSKARVEVTMMEYLYHEAVKASREYYNDKQVYVYCYLGFFHKDGGQEEEYRLGLALQFFAQAARVASTYKYEWGDTLQLTKVFTKVSEFIVSEILARDNQPRTWRETPNAVTCAKWLVAFFDYLCLWEEFSGGDSFLPICKANHKTGIAKAFALLPLNIRKEALEERTDTKSRRFQGPLRTALVANKITLSDMHLTIISDLTRSRRKRKISLL